VKRRTAIDETATTTTTVTRAATLAGFTAAVATTHGVHLRDLAPMTTLHVQTRNSQYRIIVSAGDAVLVEGGQFFPCLTPCARERRQRRRQLPQGRLDRRRAPHGDPGRWAPDCDIAVLDISTAPANTRVH
jgi:hypothetical protein